MDLLAIAGKFGQNLLLELNFKLIVISSVNLIEELSIIDGS